MWDLVWPLIGLVAGCFIGGKVGFAVARDSMSPEIKELSRLVSYHRSGQLQILQRELANILIRRDALRFLEVYEKVYEESEALKTAEKSILEAQYLLLSNKYPQYADFDLLCTRDYVLYSDIATQYSSEELEQRYHDILLFQALQVFLGEYRWPKWSVANNKELEHLKEYVQKVIDSKFQKRLEQANYVGRQRQEIIFETPEFRVVRVPSFFPYENAYGIHLKSTNEYGLYGFSVDYSSVDDDGDIKFFEQYYRSDAGFVKQEILGRVII